MIKFIPVRHIKKSTLQINREIHQMPYTILYFAKYFENDTTSNITNEIIFEITFLDPNSKVRETILMPFRKLFYKLIEEDESIYIDNNNNMIVCKKNNLYITIKYKNQNYKFYIVLSDIGYRKKCDAIG
jgi:hypothetical protein